MMRKFIKKEDGNAFVLIALGFSLMISALGLVVDGGHLYMTKSHLQKTANAAALSGAQEIPNSQVAVNQVVDEVLGAHGEQASLQSATIDNYKQLNVVLEKNVSLFFSSLFGIDHYPVKVYAKAGLNPLGEAVGAVPLGVDESVTLEYGHTYTLKVDAGDSTSGNFGVLALEGPGAKTYGETLQSGFDETLKVGDIISTQTGNIAGPTRESINYRIDNCPYPLGETYHRDCTRVMLVLVYKPYEQTTNQMKSVQITGFAYFYVTERMGSDDDSIKGIFIERAGPGMNGEGNPPDRGAYGISLKE